MVIIVFCNGGELRKKREKRVESGSRCDGVFGCARLEQVERRRRATMAGRKVVVHLDLLRWSIKREGDVCQQKGKAVREGCLSVPNQIDFYWQIFKDFIRL